MLWWWDAADGLEPMVGGDPTFTRASSGLIVPDNAGMVRPVAADIPRFPFVDVGGERLPALLLEPSDKNLCLRTEAADHSAWTKTNLTIDSDDTIAPDGQVTSDFLNETTANAEHKIEQAVTITADTDICVLIFAKAKARTDLKVVSDAAGSAGLCSVWFDLSGDGTVGTTAVTLTTTLLGTFIKRLDNGWYLCGFVCNHGSGDTSTTIDYRVGVATEDDSYTGVVGSGLWVWGMAGIDDIVGAVSYPGVAAGSTITRAVESMQWAGAPAPEAMVIYLDLVLVNPCMATGNSRLFQIGKSDGTDPRIFIRNAVVDRIHCDYDPGTNTIGFVNLTSPAPGDRVQLALSLDAAGAGRLTVSHEGAAAVSGAFSAAAEGMATAWSDNVVWLNSIGSATVNAHKYRRLVIVKPTNLDSALDGTEDDELINEMAELEVNEDRTLTELY